MNTRKERLHRGRHSKLGGSGEIFSNLRAQKCHFLLFSAGSFQWIKWRKIQYLVVYFTSLVFSVRYSTEKRYNSHAIKQRARRVTFRRAKTLFLCERFFKYAESKTKMFSGNKNIDFSDFSYTQGRMCVYGGYTPVYGKLYSVLKHFAKP